MQVSKHTNVLNNTLNLMDLIPGPPGWSSTSTRFTEKSLTHSISVLSVQSLLIVY